MDKIQDDLQRARKLENAQVSNAVRLTPQHYLMSVGGRPADIKLSGDQWVVTLPDHQKVWGPKPIFFDTLADAVEAVAELRFDLISPPPVTSKQLDSFDFTAEDGQSLISSLKAYLVSARSYEVDPDDDLESELKILFDDDNPSEKRKSSGFRAIHMIGAADSVLTDSQKRYWVIEGRNAVQTLEPAAPHGAIIIMTVLAMQDWQLDSGKRFRPENHTPPTGDYS